MTTVKRWLDSPTADLVWKAMAGVALLLSLAIGGVQLKLTACQAAYAEASNISQRARAEAAEADRLALDRMLQVVADNPRGSLDAIREYNATRAAADAQRERNPIPPPPSSTCG